MLSDAILRSCAAGNRANAAGPLRSSWFFPAIALLWTTGAILLQLLRVVDANGAFSARDALALIKHMKSDDHLAYDESKDVLASGITFSNVVLVSLSSLVIVVSLRWILLRTMECDRNDDGEKSACMEWVQFAVAIIVFNLSLTAVYHLLVLLRRDVVVVTLHCGGPPQFLPVADAAAMLSGRAPPPGCEVRTFDMLLNLTDLCTALFLVHYALVCVGGSARTQAQQRRHSISRTVLVVSLFSLSLCIPFDAVIAWTPATSSAARAGTVVSAIVSLFEFGHMIRISKRWERAVDRCAETDRERLVRQTSSSLRVPLAVLASLQALLATIDGFLEGQRDNGPSASTQVAARAVQFATMMNKGVMIPASVAIIGVCACIVFSHQLIHERLVEEAKANVESQKLVIRYVCHEVRVPLNSMLMGMELLMDMLQASHLLDGDAPDAAQLEAPDAAMSLDPSDVADARATVQQMFLGAGSMKRILNDVLTVASLEQGRVSLIKEPFALGRVLRVVNSTFQADARRRGVTLRCVNDTESLPPGLSLLGDADRLIQVLSNLVSNALKFTPSGREVSIVFRLVVPKSFLPVAELAAGTQSMPSIALATGTLQPSTAISTSTLSSVGRQRSYNVSSALQVGGKEPTGQEFRSVQRHSTPLPRGRPATPIVHAMGEAGGTPTPLATTDAPADSGYSTSLSNPTQGTQSASTLHPDSSRGSNPHINSSYNSGATEMPPVVQRRTRWLLECRVVDQGVGIAEEDLKKLFQPFQQLGSGKKERQNGTGLGLSICKNIIHLHGGEMGVVSTGEGQGSTFWFRVPLRTAPLLDEKDTASGDRSAGRSGVDGNQRQSPVPAPLADAGTLAPVGSLPPSSTSEGETSKPMTSLDTASRTILMPARGRRRESEVASLTADDQQAQDRTEEVQSAVTSVSSVNKGERDNSSPRRPTFLDDQPAVCGHVPCSSDSSHSSWGSSMNATTVAFVQRCRSRAQRHCSSTPTQGLRGPQSRVQPDAIAHGKFSTQDRMLAISDMRTEFRMARTEAARLDMASGKMSGNIARQRSLDSMSSSSDAVRAGPVRVHLPAPPTRDHSVTGPSATVFLHASRPFLSSVRLAPLESPLPDASTSGSSPPAGAEQLPDGMPSRPTHQESLGLATVPPDLTQSDGQPGQVRKIGGSSVLSVCSRQAVSPATSSASPAPSLPGSRITSRRLANLTAVVVDDVQGNRMLLARLLRREGCIVHEAEHGAAALSAVDRLLEPGQDPDTTPPGRIVVLMDANMPVMGGLEAATELRRRHGGRVRVIGVTGSATEEERSAYAAAGADEVLVKPIGKKDLLSAILSGTRTGTIESA